MTSFIYAILHAISQSTVWIPLSTIVALSLTCHTAFCCRLKLYDLHCKYIWTIYYRNLYNIALVQNIRKDRNYKITKKGILRYIYKIKSKTYIEGFIGSCGPFLHFSINRYVVSWINRNIAHYNKSSYYYVRDNGIIHYHDRYSWIYCTECRSKLQNYL